MCEVGFEVGIGSLNTREGGVERRSVEEMRLELSVCGLVVAVC